MRLLSDTSAPAMRAAIDGEVRCDYVYMYPPRQAYRPFGPDVDAATQAAKALATVDAVNLYVHVPFCRQICAYCNLYAVPSRRQETHERYVAAVLAEAALIAPTIRRKQTRTFYVGGGTPSILSPDLLARLIEGIASAAECDLAEVEEVALEVAPESVSKERLAAIREMGFTRINLGVQSVDVSELDRAGRRRADGIDRSLDAAMLAGFENVCVDLIYGLNGQTSESWQRSIDHVLRWRPETICAYALTLRPGTGFARGGYIAVDDHEQYRRYDVVNDTLQAAGYEQQTHVRWALPGRGGYLQKQYHWACEPLVGLGAGARSYLHGIDSRNGYSLRRRISALDDYLLRVEGGSAACTEGFVMDDDERMRKAVILGLNCLDLQRFRQAHGIDALAAFKVEFETLFDLGLIDVNGDTLGLTDRGSRHRDVAVQPFVSDRVRELVLSFDYDE